MPETYFSLSPSDKKELLEFTVTQSGRPAHLLEKDLWVVWGLAALANSDIGPMLTFKGGTSLSKAYKVIDRFSEDLDLTCDVRHLLGDLLKNGKGLPQSVSQAAKWTKAVRERLPLWIEDRVRPVLENALTLEKIEAELSLSGKDSDSLILKYPPITKGMGYAAPAVRLEFGARATGEPHARIRIECDMKQFVPNVAFPEANLLVMKPERTFWEKLTAAHVFCRQARMRGERFGRHWYDIVMLAKSSYLRDNVFAGDCAKQVVAHKSMFFREKTPDGSYIDYEECLRGRLQIVPQDGAYAELQKDYSAMIAEGMLYAPLDFNEIMAQCADIEQRVNSCAVKMK